MVVARFFLMLVLLGLPPASASADGWEGWTVGGFRVQTYRHMLDPALFKDEIAAGESPSDATGLRFTGPDGKVAAEFPGKGDTEAWNLIGTSFGIDGVAAPLVAFMHYSGGVHCCSEVRVFRLGPVPAEFARTPYQEGDGATIVETDKGWVVPSHDMSLAYSFGRAFAGSPFPPVYWRLTAAGFVPAPELQKTGPDGLPALYAACRNRGKDEEGQPTCGDFAFYPTTDAELLAAIDKAVSAAKGDAGKLPGTLPPAAFERFAQGGAALVLDRLAAAKAPPDVARILVQSFAARAYWPEIVSLNGLGVLLAPLAADGPAVAAASGADVRPIGPLGGKTLGLVAYECRPDQDSRLRLFDIQGGELGALTLEGCARLRAPAGLAGDDGFPALMAAAGDNGIRAIAAITPTGGMAIPVDIEGLVIRAATADELGRVTSITLGRITDGEEAVGKACLLDSVPAALACIDGL